MDRLLSEPIWQDIEYRATYAIVQNYIEKAEETWCDPQKLDFLSVAV